MKRYNADLSSETYPFGKSRGIKLNLHMWVYAIILFLCISIANADIFLYNFSNSNEGWNKYSGGTPKYSSNRFESIDTTEVSIYKNDSITFSNGFNISFDYNLGTNYIRLGLNSLTAGVGQDYKHYFFLANNNVGYLGSDASLGVDYITCNLITGSNSYGKIRWEHLNNGSSYIFRNESLICAYTFSNPIPSQYQILILSSRATNSFFDNVTYGYPSSECVSNLLNTSLTIYSNKTLCNGMIYTQERNYTTYDLNGCVSNTTFYENRTILCALSLETEDLNTRLTDYEDVIKMLEIVLLDLGLLFFAYYLFKQRSTFAGFMASLTGFGVDMMLMSMLQNYYPLLTFNRFWTIGTLIFYFSLPITRWTFAFVYGVMER